MVYDDYNSNIRADQSTIGTLTLNIGSSSLRNAYKLNRGKIKMNKKCNISRGGSKPQLLGGFGKINFGKQYRQGNRVYDSNAVAMCLNAQPVGNAGGYSYLYLVKK